MIIMRLSAVLALLFFLPLVFNPIIGVGEQECEECGGQATDDGCGRNIELIVAVGPATHCVPRAAIGRVQTADSRLTAETSAVQAEVLRKCACGVTINLNS